MPIQNPIGCKTSLGGITKRGSYSLRNLLIQGAKSVVALANKNVRILWIVMTRDKRYDARHVSAPPAGVMPAAA